GTSSPARRRGSSKPSAIGGRAGSPKCRATSRSSSRCRSEPAFDRHDITHLIDGSEGWKDPHPDRDHDQGADAAQHYRRYRSKQGRGDAGLEAAELVGGTDEERAHRAHSPAHDIGRCELHQCGADVDADLIPGARAGERRKGQAEMARYAKHDGADAEDHHRGKHRAAHPTVYRAAGEIERCEGGTERGGAAQETETRRSDVQDVASVDRQEGDRATQQHREEIERDRSEDHRSGAHELYTLADSREAAREYRSVRRNTPA